MCSAATNTSNDSGLACSVLDRSMSRLTPRRKLTSKPDLNVEREVGAARTLHGDRASPLALVRAAVKGAAARSASRRPASPAATPRRHCISGTTWARRAETAWLRRVDHETFARIRLNYIGYRRHHGRKYG
jgi:hypothetical protein